MSTEERDTLAALSSTSSKRQPDSYGDENVSCHHSGDATAPQIVPGDSNISFTRSRESVSRILANAADPQNRRGHKTDPNDTPWLAYLLRHAMIRLSFIPPPGTP